MHCFWICLLGLFLTASAQIEYTTSEYGYDLAIYKINLVDPGAIPAHVLARDVNNGTQSTNATCPADDGKEYYPPNGRPYVIKCGYYDMNNQTTIQSSEQPSVESCAASCSAYNADSNHTTKCAGANYYAAGSNDNPPANCYLRSYVSLRR